jgi:predicted DNA-binding protein with PD1-like motif
MQEVNEGRRRCCIGLATVLSCIPSAQADAAPAPAGYTKGFVYAEKGRAPGLRTRILAQGKQQRTWFLLFAPGDELMSGLAEWAAEHHIASAELRGWGNFVSALFGWYDVDKKAFANIAIDERTDITGLIGDIAAVAGLPQPHIHGSVANREGTLRGGHLIEGKVGLEVELFVTEYFVPLVKTYRPDVELSLLDLSVD